MKWIGYIYKWNGLDIYMKTYVFCLMLYLKVVNGFVHLWPMSFNFPRALFIFEFKIRYGNKLRLQFIVYSFVFSLQFSIPIGNSF